MSLQSFNISAQMSDEKIIDSIKYITDKNSNNEIHKTYIYYMCNELEKAKILDSINWTNYEDMFVYQEFDVRDSSNIVIIYNRTNIDTIEFTVNIGHPQLEIYNTLGRNFRYSFSHMSPDNTDKMCEKYKDQNHYTEKKYLEKIKIKKFDLYTLKEYRKREKIFYNNYLDKVKHTYIIFYQARKSSNNNCILILYPPANPKGKLLFCNK